MEGLELIADLPEAQPLTRATLEACLARLSAPPEPAPLLFPASWKSEMARTGYLTERHGKTYWAGSWCIFTDPL
jgi:hypothetical protein